MYMYISSYGHTSMYDVYNPIGAIALDRDIFYRQGVLTYGDLTSPPENILKFNVPGGECPSSVHFLRTWPPIIYFGKNYLAVFPQT
jgi:hypothetical protein